MLETISYMSAAMALGVYKLPQNSTIIGDKAVRDTRNGASGVLIHNSVTGLYSLFSCGCIHGVDQREGKQIAAQEM